MFYTVYRITNLINSKTYIGKHKTKNLDDGYFGSGKLIRRAIRKYGKENFMKEILFIFDNEKEMNEKEAELVYVNEETYNLCSGGTGGWDYINSNPDIIKNRNQRAGYEAAKNFMLDSDKNSRSGLQHFKKKTAIFDPRNRYDWSGKKHSQETKLKISNQRNGTWAGELNPSFGMRWVTDGLHSKRIKKNEDIPPGFRPGRVLKKSLTARLS